MDRQSASAGCLPAGAELHDPEVPGPGSLPLSVVIPVHNSGSQLERCLAALMKNRLEQAEIVVVDDASSDETPGIAESAAHRSAVPISCLRLERRSGPAAARNEGLRAARNPYILFLDADIVLPDDGVESLRSMMARFTGRAEIAGVMGVYSDAIPWRDFCSDCKNLHVCFLHQTTETPSPYLHTAILLIRKKVLEEEGGFDTGLATAEDFRMGVKLGSKGYRFVIDRATQGTHLKRYTLRSVLREDWRRVRDLLSIQLEEDQQKFLYRAHRWSRLLSAALPLPILAATAASLWLRAWAGLAVPLWLAFCLCNLPFLKYVLERRGFLFSVKSAGLVFLEMLCAQTALVYWTGRHILRGDKRRNKDPRTPGYKIT